MVLTKKIKKINWLVKSKKPMPIDGLEIILNLNKDDHKATDSGLKIGDLVYKIRSYKKKKKDEYEIQICLTGVDFYTLYSRDYQLISNNLTTEENIEEINVNKKIEEILQDKTGIKKENIESAYFIGLAKNKKKNTIICSLETNLNKKQFRQIEKYDPKLLVLPKENINAFINILDGSIAPLAEEVLKKYIS